MPSIRAPASKKTATLQVAVKCRPLTEAERRRSRNIIQVIDDKNVVVLDPDLSKDYLDRIQNRTKEKRYGFDHVFGPECTNSDVYKSVHSTIAGVIQGLNATVFAYGSTGRMFHEYPFLELVKRMGLSLNNFQSFEDSLVEFSEDSLKAPSQWK